MTIFGHAKSTEWHRRVDATANEQHPTNNEGELNPTFPWSDLQQITIDYLKKKGKLATQERDRKLVTLVREHGAKDIAMAACGLLMSPHCVRDLVWQELNVHPDRGHELYFFLQTVVAASHDCPAAVDRHEAQRAQWLIPFCSPRGLSAAAQGFRALMALLMDTIPQSSMLHPHTEALTRKSCMSFVAELEVLRKAGLWLRAYAVTEWLSTLAGISLRLPAQSLRMLSVIFPAWHKWASWGPSKARLMLCNGLSSSQRANIQDLSALEGPDFTGSGRSTLWEGLIAIRHPQGSRFAIDSGNIHIDLRDGDLTTAYLLMNRFLSTIDAACRAGSDEIDLLAHFCIGTTLDAEGLRILELVNALGDSLVTAAMLRVHNARKAERNEQLAAITSFLPTLNSPRAEELRQILVPYLLDSVSHCLEGLQNDLGRLLESGQAWDGTENKLQQFGEFIGDTLWIRPLLHMSTQNLFESWPTKKTVESLHSLRLAAFILPNEKALFLAKEVDKHCMHSLISQGAAEPTQKALIESLISFWDAVPDDDRRVIAVIVAGGSSHDFEYICRILAKLPVMPDDFTQSLRKELQRYHDSINKDLACVNLANLIASTHLYGMIALWKPVLEAMINQRGQQLLEYTSQNLEAKSWIEWLNHLRQIYGNASRWLPESSPPILWSRLINWGERIGSYSPTIVVLQTTLGSDDWLKCIQMASDDPLLEDTLIKILEIVTFQSEKRCQPVFHKAVTSLKRDGSNAELSLKAISLITTTTTNGSDACNRVLDMYEISVQLAEAFVGLYKNSNEMTQADVSALNALASMLTLCVASGGKVLNSSLDAACNYVVDQFNQIYEEAQRLEDLRSAFKFVDPDGTSALLESLGIEDSTAAQDAIASLPASLIDLVEIAGHQEVEMQMPLTLTALQRIALGVGTANNIIVRLNLPDSNLPLAFCLHLDDDSKTNEGHRPWMVSDGNRAPVVPVCYGRPNRALFQLSRALFRHLQEGYNSLAEVYRVLIGTLKDLGNHCVVCGTHLGASLRRSTLCKSAECFKIFGRSGLAVRLSDIMVDTPAVDAILTLIYAAAASERPELLPGCPIKDTQTIRQILNLIPPIKQLQTASDMSYILKKHAKAEELLSWAANGYRGFFTSASGNLRIPGMAKSHQFILASAAPELEAAFAAQVALQGATRVVFHATSLDRTYSILTQGLQIKSGTSLQRTGAYFGKGIYVSESPTVAAAYFAPLPATSTWTGSTFKNVRVLLACEFATSPWTAPVNTNIYVVTNPSQLIVRHVFLMPPAAVVPTLATHVTPAMSSVFSFLRSSAP